MIEERSARILSGTEVLPGACNGRDQRLEENKAAVLTAGRLRQDAYGGALAGELRRFENCLNVHDLPDIAHYWSQRYIRPKLLSFGFDSPNAMFAKYLEERCREEPGRPRRFVSLGSGNCDLEIKLALHLLASGHELFVIDCLDLNPSMLGRGRAAAECAGVREHLKFVPNDFNTWIPAHRYDAAIANQALHHVLNLEGLFGQVKQSLTTGGCFLISDMIGRNGHLRWPEALEIVHEFWRLLPPSYRFNLRLCRYEEMFQDWDCAGEGFEGIRSQDILPLLLRHFRFRLFVPFGNVIDPFVDRSFGHHFDAGAIWDREFIDEIHRRDQAGIASGQLTPTHMIAVVGSDFHGDSAFPGNLSPEFCARKPDEVRHRGSGIPPAAKGFRVRSWPHDPVQELEIVCGRLAQSETAAVQMRAELEDRTAWALRLDAQLEDRTAWALRLDAQLEERTTWALKLRDDLEEITAHVIRLSGELEERTAWALKLREEAEAHDEIAAWATQLNYEMESKTRRVLQLEAELHGYLHHPLRYLLRLSRGAVRFMERKIRFAGNIAVNPLAGFRRIPLQNRELKAPGKEEN